MRYKNVVFFCGFHVLFAYFEMENVMLFGVKYHTLEICFIFFLET